MARVLGEAKLDVASGKWYVIVWIENGEVLFKSDCEFGSQEEAEDFLIEALRGLADLSPPEPDNATAAAKKHKR